MIIAVNLFSTEVPQDIILVIRRLCSHYIFLYVLIIMVDGSKT